MKRDVIHKIAAKHGVETLETRNLDRLDFHSISVWDLKEMLERAFEEGQHACTECARKENIRTQLRTGS